MDWNSFWPPITGAIGAVIGAVIVGYFTLKATRQSFDNQKVQADDSEKKLIKGVLQAIHDELETIFERYQTTMGGQVENLPDDKGLDFYYPIVSDFFTVYNGNSFLIGRIPDNDLRRGIIKTYTTAKGLVDSFRLNNDLVLKLELSRFLYHESGMEIHEKQVMARESALVNYAKSLKEGHAYFKVQVNELLKDLRENDALSEVNS